MEKLPESLISLHAEEEGLRAKTLALVEADPDLAAHLHMTEIVIACAGNV